MRWKIKKVVYADGRTEFFPMKSYIPLIYGYYEDMWGDVISYKTLQDAQDFIIEKQLDKLTKTLERKRNTVIESVYYKFSAKED